MFAWWTRFCFQDKVFEFMIQVEIESKKWRIFIYPKIASPSKLNGLVWRSFDRIFYLELDSSADYQPLIVNGQKSKMEDW